MIGRYFFAAALVFCCVSGLMAQTFYGTTDLKAFRDGRDKEFRKKDESPLKAEDFATFKGLNYFPTDSVFRVYATFKRTAGEKYFQMPTSSGNSKKFVKYGELDFKLGNTIHRLNVYQIDPAIIAAAPEYSDLLFVPFKDLTIGKETYGVGRYLDIKVNKGRRVLLDFNLAYNPNCAYGSSKYSCPIPPAENLLKVEIKAGEKKYGYSTETPNSTLQ